MLLCAVTFLSTGSIAQNKTYRIRDRGPAGGWVFYDKGNFSGGWRYLEAAPHDLGEAQWGCPDLSIPGAGRTAIGSGKRNTREITVTCIEENTAAKMVMAYNGGGQSDWFLPSKDELNAMYENLAKQETGGFINDLYWSSSDYSADRAWGQFFDDGSQSERNKFNKARVRAVRAF